MHASITRRRFSLTLGATGSMALAGCETQPLLRSLSNMGNDLVSGIKNLGKGGDIYRDRVNTPDMMQTAFDLYQAAQAGTLAQVQLDRMRSLVTQHNEMVEKTAAQVASGELQDVLQWIEAVAPLTAQTMAQIDAAYYLWDQSRKRKNVRATRQKDGSFALPALTGLKVRYRGHCMDSGLPAPGNGELLDMTYIDERLYTTLRPVFKSLCRWAAQTKDASAQTLTWIVTSAGDEHGYCARMNQEHFNKLQQIHPDGGNIVRNHHNTQVMAQRLLQKGLEKAGLNKFMQGVNMNSSRQVDQAADRELTELINEGLKDQGLGQPGFNLLGPQISTRSVGIGALSNDLTFINTGSTTWNIDLAELVAKPRRRRQSISGILPTNQGEMGVTSLALPGNKVSAQQKSEMDTLFESFENSVMKWARLKGPEVLLGLGTSYAATENAKRLLQKAQSAELKAMAMRIGKNAKLFVDAAPVIGNVLSLYEAVSGKDWLTGGDLSNIERVASLIGTIPGAGALKTAGATGAKIANTAVVKALEGTTKWDVRETISWTATAGGMFLPDSIKNWNPTSFYQKVKTSIFDTP